MFGEAMSNRVMYGECCKPSRDSPGGFAASSVGSSVWLVGVVLWWAWLVPRSEVSTSKKCVFSSGGTPFLFLFLLIY